MINDKITLIPSQLNGVINIPPSKSILHRALICAALSNGESIISNINYSIDIATTINALKNIGADFIIRNNQIKVKGIKKLELINNVIECNESGSTLRFLIPLFSLTNQEVIFKASSSLLKRPLDTYIDIFKDNILISGDHIKINQSIKATKYLVKGNISSQFISGLLFSLALLKEDSSIIVDGILESASYINITIDVLSKFGVVIDKLDNGFYIKGNQRYKTTDIYIEADYSQAAYYYVANELGSNIIINGLNKYSLQADKEILNFINIINNEKEPIIDIINTPDLGPIVSLLAGFSKKKVTIINAHRLKYKESNRLEAIYDVLSKLGVNISITDDSIYIDGYRLIDKDITMNCFNDHRIVMMESIASTVLNKNITIKDASSVNKSYPNFFVDFVSLGGKIIIEE